MQIKNRLRFIGAIAATMGGLLIISGCSADKKQLNKLPLKKTTAAAVNYNIGNVPSRDQWNSPKTGNLVVIFTTKDALSMPGSINGQRNMNQISLDHNKKNVIKKSFYADNFSSFQLIPGVYNLKNIYTSIDTSPGSKLSHKTLKIKAGETQVIWSYITDSKEAPLITQAKVLTPKLSKYVYGVITSSDKSQKLDPRICFRIAPVTKVQELNATAKVKELLVEKQALATTNANLKKQLTALVQSKSSLTPLLQKITKDKAAALTTVKNKEQQVREVKQKIVANANETSSITNEIKAIIAKLSQLKKWYDKTGDVSAKNTTGVAQLNKEKDLIAKKVQVASTKIKDLQTELKSKKLAQVSLKSLQERLVAEQTVLTKILEKLNKNEQEKRQNVTRIDSSIQGEKSSKKQAVALMTALLADDQLADDKLADINIKIKNIYNNIKLKETEKKVALSEVDLALNKITEHKTKLAKTSSKAMNYLKDIELTKQSLSKTQLQLRTAELSLKDLMVDKKLLDSKLNQLSQLVTQSSGDTDEMRAEIKELKETLSRLTTNKDTSAKNRLDLQKELTATEQALKNAEDKHLIILTKLNKTEQLLDEKCTQEVDLTNRLYAVADKSKYLTSKVKIAQNNDKLAKENIDYRSQTRTLSVMIAELRDTTSVLQGKVKFDKLQLAKSKELMAKLETDKKGLQDALKIAQNNTKLEKGNTQKAQAHISDLEQLKKQLEAKILVQKNKITQAGKASNDSKVQIANQKGKYNKLESDKLELVRQIGLASAQTQNNLVHLADAAKLEKILTEKVSMLESALKTALNSVKRSDADTKFSIDNLALASKLTKELKAKTSDLNKKLAVSEAQLKVTNQALKESTAHSKTSDVNTNNLLERLKQVQSEKQKITKQSKAAALATAKNFETAQHKSELALQKSKDESGKRLNSTKAESEKLINDAMETIKKLNSKIKSIELSSKKTAADGAEKTTALTTLKTLNDGLEKEITTSDKEIAEAMETISFLRTKVKSAETALKKEAANRLEKKEEVANIYTKKNSLEQELIKVKRALKASNSEKGKSHDELAKIDANFEALKIKSATLRENLDKVMDKSTTDKKFMSTALEKLQKEFETAFEQKKKHQTALKSAFDKIDRISKENKLLTENLTETQGKYNLINEGKNKQQLLTTEIQDKMEVLSNESNNRVRKLREQLDEKEKHISTVKKEAITHQKQNEILQRDVNKLKSQLETITDKLANSREGIDKMRIDQKKVEDDLRFAGDKINIVENSQSEAGELIDELKKDRNSLGLDVKQLEGALADSKKKFEEQKNKARTTSEQLSSKLNTKDKEIGFKNSTITRLESQEKDLQKEVSELKAQLKTRNFVIKRLANDLGEKREREKIPAYRKTPAR